MPALREYEKAVQENTDAYLSALKPEDLDQPMALSGLGLGEQNLAWVINTLLIGHVNNIAGEISCLKGCQGHQGYPF